MACPVGDTYKETAITQVLQKDCTWTSGADGEIIAGTYTQYGVEEYYIKQ